MSLTRRLSVFRSVPMGGTMSPGDPSGLIEPVDAEKISRNAMRRVHPGTRRISTGATQSAAVRAKRVGSEAMRGKTMRTITIASAAFAPLSVAAITIATAATAVAASPTVAGFGTREQLFDDGGAVITGWTVTDFRPSSDTIPYQVAGRLYEATAAVEADQGTVTPMVPNFNARATDGETYRALYNVATPQGVNPSALPPGAKSTGKIYFDVTGAIPNSVVYNDGSQDLLIWNGTASAPAEAPAPAPAAPPATPPPARSEGR